MTAIRQISQKWLEQKRAQAGFTAAGPNRDAILVEIAEAEKHVAARDIVEQRAKAANWIRNRFAGKCCKTGKEVKVGVGFARRDGVKWVVYSWQAVCEELGLSLETAR